MLFLGRFKYHSGVDIDWTEDGMSALVKLGLLSSPFSTLFLKFPLCVQKNPAKPALLMNFVVILLCAFLFY